MKTPHAVNTQSTQQPVHTAPSKNEGNDTLIENKQPRALFKLEEQLRYPSGACPRFTSACLDSCFCKTDPTALPEGTF